MNPIDTLFEVATPIQRKLLENVRYVPETECWEWLNGSTNIRVSSEKAGNAKRLSFEAFIGPVIDGDTVISSCNGDYCINPQHLTARPKRLWNKDTCAKEAKKYSSRVAFQKGSSPAFGAAFNNKWLDEICEHMETIKKPNGYWNHERCQQEANKYPNKSEFFEKSRQAYYAAKRHGIFDSICSHMSRPEVYNKRWSFEKCKVEADKFNSFRDFQTQSRPAYSAAKKAGWLTAICEHMCDYRPRKPRRLTPIAA